MGLSFTSFTIHDEGIVKRIGMAKKALSSMIQILKNLSMSMKARIRIYTVNEMYYMVKVGIWMRGMDNKDRFQEENRYSRNVVLR